MFHYVSKGSVLIKVLESGVNCVLMVALVFNLIPDYKERLGWGSVWLILNLHILPPPMSCATRLVVATILFEHMVETGTKQRNPDVFCKNTLWGVLLSKPGRWVCGRINGPLFW